MTLPAIETLTALGAAHEVRRFDPALDATAAAAALGLPPGAILKTLAVASMQGVTLCCLGSDRELDLPRLGDGRMALVGRDALPRMTGFTAGAVTPIAGPGGRRFPILLDEAALAHPLVGVAAGAAGVELLLSPAELVRATAAHVQALSLA
jgi:Cys-tRNA(Pro)/Cys-tRNA(Cys) deacylase